MYLPLIKIFLISQIKSRKKTENIIIKRLMTLTFYFKIPIKLISYANNSPEVINYVNELLIYAWTRQKSEMLLVLI